MKILAHIWEKVRYSPPHFCERRKISTLSSFPEHPYIFLINYEVGKFIVFINSEYDIDWSLHDDWSDKKSSVQEILNQAARLECRISPEWPEAILINAKRMIGEGIARSFWDECDAANKMLKEAEAFINQKSQEISRQWTLCTCIWTTMTMVFIAFLSVYFHNWMTHTLGHSFFLLVLASCCGGVGALLSVFFRIGKLQTINSAGIGLHRTEGFARILVGSICGFLVAILVKTGILFPIFSDVKHFDLLILAIATIAGASEKMVPNIVMKISTQEPCSNKSNAHIEE